MHQRITSRAKTTLGTRTAWVGAVAFPLLHQSLRTQINHRAAQQHQIAMYSFSESEGNSDKSMETKVKFRQNPATYSATLLNKVVDNL